MVGFFYTAVNTNAAAREQTARTFGELTGLDPASSFIATPASSSALVRPDAEISIFSPLEPNSLEGAMFTSPNRVFCDAYGEAFLAHVYNAVKPGGRLLIPFTAKAQPKRSGFWSIEWIRSKLGKETEMFKNERFLLYEKQGNLIAPDSVFTAFVGNVRELSQIFYNDCSNVDISRIRDECSDFLVEATVPPGFGSAARDHTVADPGKELDEFLSFIGYSVAGVAYKTESLRSFIELYMPRKTGLKTVDLGGGVGFVDMELLITSPQVDRVSVCDPVSHTLPLTRRMFELFKAKLENRFRYHLCVAQDFRYEEKVDIVSDFAALLYVPRDLLDDVLSRAWAALNKGGILVIHENIKRDLFKTTSYYDSVFTVDELEERLKRFGKIDYYRSSDFAPMKRADVGEQTVFRVIKKKR